MDVHMHRGEKGVCGIFAVSNHLGIKSCVRILAKSDMQIMQVMHGVVTESWRAPRVKGSAGFPVVIKHLFTNIVSVIRRTLRRRAVHCFQAASLPFLSSRRVPRSFVSPGSTASSLASSMY